MKRLLFAFVLLTTPAAAKDIPVVMTEEQIRAAVALFDLAVQSKGLAVAEAAVFLTKHLEAAVKTANEPPKETPPK